MTLKVFSERFTDLSGTEASQKWSPDANIFIETSRHSFVFFNSVSFGTLSMDIYSDRSGSPGQSIKTSTTAWTTASIIAAGKQLEDGSDFTDLRYAFVELYFNWGNIPIKSALDYHFVLSATSYTGTANAFIGWVKEWPTPTYSTGVTTTIISQVKNPKTINGIVGAPQ